MSKKKVQTVKVEPVKEDTLPAVQDECSLPVLKALEIVVKDSTDYALATDYLSVLNDTFKKATAEKNRMLKPLNEALKVEKARWKPIEDQIGKAISILKAKMKTFVEKDLKRQEEEEKKILKKGYKKPETTMKKIAAVEVAVSIGVRKISRLEIFDESLIPREYLQPIESLIKEAIKSGKEVPGCRMVKETIIAAR